MAVVTAPEVTRCGLCRGRCELETANGYDVVCWQCGGSGDQPPTCHACSGRQSWQLADGSVVECSTCTNEGEDTCSRCGLVQDEPLSYAGLCRSCDFDEELQWGYVPSYLGVRSGPE